MAVRLITTSSDSTAPKSGFTASGGLLELEDALGVAREEELPGLVREAFQRSRRLYPLVGREYRRIGFQSGLKGFNDRSTAFGVVGLGYNHAVSDIAEVLRYIWIAAGGADTRPRVPLRGQETVLVPPESAGR